VKTLRRIAVQAGVAGNRPVRTVIPPVYAVIPPVYAVIPPVYTVIPPVYTLVPPVCTVVWPVRRPVRSVRRFIRPECRFVQPVHTVLRRVTRYPGRSARFLRARLHGSGRYARFAWRLMPTTPRRELHSRDRWPH